MKVNQINLVTTTKSANVAQLSTQNKTAVHQSATNPILSQLDTKASQVISNYFKASQAMPTFTGYSCKTSGFRPKEVEDMPCTCCGRPMMTNKQVDNFVSTVAHAHGAELDKTLDKNMQYFRAEEKAIIHYIQKQLKNMPDATLVDAVKRTSAEPREILHDEQIDVLKRTSAKSKEMLGENNLVQKTVEKTIENFENIYVNGKGKKIPNVPSNRGEFLAALVNLEKQGINHRDLHEILDVAVQMPESVKVIEKMLEYKHGGNSKFAHRLIQKAVVTAEHIHPKSLGGPNHTANYMGECQECNGSRGNMSYDEWMKKYPNMPDNIQDHIDALTEEIIKGKIGGRYDDYPIDLKNAVERETGGKTVLKVKTPEEIDKIREERGIEKPKAEKIENEHEHSNKTHGNHKKPKKLIAGAIIRRSVNQ